MEEGSDELSRTMPDHRGNSPPQYVAHLPGTNDNKNKRKQSFLEESTKECNEDVTCCSGVVNPQPPIDIGKVKKPIHSSDGHDKTTADDVSCHDWYPNSKNQNAASGYVAAEDDVEAGSDVRSLEDSRDSAHLLSGDVRSRESTCSVSRKPRVSIEITNYGRSASARSDGADTMSLQQLDWGKGDACNGETSDTGTNTKSCASKLVDPSRDGSKRGRRAKVSIGSADIASCTSQSDDKVDKMIAQPSFWSRSDECGERSGTETRSLDEANHDSDVECLGSTSGARLVNIGSPKEDGPISSAHDLAGHADKGPIARKPKVSTGSIDHSFSSENEDEMDEMIAQQSIFGSDGCERESNKIKSIHSEDEEDDSDIECLGSLSRSEGVDDSELDGSKIYHRGNVVSNPGIAALGSSICDDSKVQGNIEPNNSESRRAGDTIFEGNASGKVITSLEGPNSQPDIADLDEEPRNEEANSPNKDVCYICGSDLTRLRGGLNGRVAHMKRCSAKYGKVLGGRKAMNTGGDFDADFVEAGAEARATSRHAETPSVKTTRATNPYDNNRWHGDASSELELSKPMNSKDVQPKQALLKQFFTAPVRSLTNVLMAGARQAAKGASIMASTNASAAVTVTAAKTATTNHGKKSANKGRWQSYRRSGNCPSYKRIPGTDFICDGFHYAKKSLSEQYFLTHFHSDHYGGITKTWSEGIIYCSLPTANLVHQQLGVDKRFLHPIPMNTPMVIESKQKPITITLLNANHCPGAIMFLFEVGNRTILHVGDFRWERALMMQAPQLRAFRDSIRLDELFLDTTYCNKKYTLPTQDEAIRAAIEVAQSEMEMSKKDTKMKTLFLFGSYTIGKEKIYLSVAEHLKQKVYVDSRRYRILSSLEWPKERMNIFTTRKSETNLWVVPLGSVNFKQMRDYMDEGNNNKVFTAPYGRVVGFRPTGWTYSARDKNQRTLPGGRPKPGRNLISSKTSGRYSVHGVPYSEHSSFPELVDCLRCLKPKKIVPTVSVSKSEEQIKLLLNELEKS
ncbi:hypothetical protein ACHAWF_017172 [Thalassiosira exigua]